MKRCNGKKKRDYAAAIGAAIRNSAKYGKPNRCYPCPDCGWWHLTTKPEWRVEVVAGA